MNEFSPDKEMLETYLSRRVQVLRDLEDCLKRGSISSFARVGHQLCGNASSFGFDSLGELAKQMEQLTPQDLPYKGPEILKRYSRWIEETKKSILN